jgi:hypothetical protein
MKLEFEKIIEGMAQYINDELYPRMNDLQEFMARVLVGRVINNEEAIKDILINNGFLRTFAIIDNEGMVDIYSLAKDLKREIGRKEKITFDIPFFGKISFKPCDVDSLYTTITGEEMKNHENH